MDEDDRFEFEVVQQHLGDGARDRDRILVRNLRDSRRGSRSYRREMRRTGLMMAGLIRLCVVALGLILTLI